MDAGSGSVADLSSSFIEQLLGDRPDASIQVRLQAPVTRESNHSLLDLCFLRFGQLLFSLR
jgi:hypothetical protein